MRLALVRIAALLGAIAVIVSCDSRATTPGGGGSSGGGGGGGPSTGPDLILPTVIIDAPVANQIVNVGDSILVQVHIHDDEALANLELVGLRISGSADLGTYLETERYSQVVIPSAGSFHPGLRDTVVRRYLKPKVATDTAVDSLIIVATARDSTGNIRSVRRRVNLAAGPQVSIITPTNGLTVAQGIPMSLSVHATHAEGVNSVSIHVVGDATFSPPLDTTLTLIPGTANLDVTFDTTLIVPASAPVGSRITIEASAIDVNRQPGSASPVIVTVRAPNTIPPLVTQQVPLRVELWDSIAVSASGDGIASVGIVVHDSIGTLIRRDSVVLPTPYTTNAQRKVPLNLTTAQQGKRIGISSFAWDQSGRVGYSVKAGTTTAQSNAALAWNDSSLVVFGKTYKLPRTGLIGDIAVDAAHGNVFLSNTSYNLLELWQNSTQSFRSSGVAVGSQPWGLFVGRSADTLLVANSGATTISRVFIGSSDPALIQEALTRRIRTRNTYLYEVVEHVTLAGKVTIEVNGPISYSDRPQYVAESNAGLVYFSTRPTASAPAGTVRYIDPSLPVPDPRQIWQYATAKAKVDGQYSYVMFNTDSIRLWPSSENGTLNDQIIVWDHPYGQAAGVLEARGYDPVAVVANLNGMGSDAEAVLDIDFHSLALTDTTFVGASADRKWIAFGEGNTTGSPGRVVLVNDPTTGIPPFFSPLVTIRDIMDNANEKIFGIALDSSGMQFGSHGLNSYFAAVDNPFHLRLEGTYDSFDNGAGIAFHPRANSINSANENRVAFVASASGSIEIVDVAYFISRGKLITKGNLYGSLRASMPLPGDPPDVVLKLFALTDNGLVVIDLTAADIKPGP